MQLRAKALTCCEVVDDGETISLGFEDADCPAMRARLTPSDD